MDRYNSKTDSISGFTVYPALSAKEFKMPDEQTLSVLTNDPGYKESFSEQQDLNPLFTTKFSASVNFPAGAGQMGESKDSVGGYGSFSLSNPVFDSSGKKIVVYYECHFSGDRSEGVYAFAESKNGGWQIYRYIQAWSAVPPLPVGF